MTKRVRPFTLRCCRIRLYGIKHAASGGASLSVTYSAVRPSHDAARGPSGRARSRPAGRPACITVRAATSASEICGVILTVADG
jgi:hypothetical protein